MPQKSNTKQVSYKSLASTLHELRRNTTANNNHHTKPSAVKFNGHNGKHAKDNNILKEREPILSMLGKEISSSASESSCSSSSGRSYSQKTSTSFDNKLKRFKHFESHSLMKKKRTSSEILLR